MIGETLKIAASNVPLDKPIIQLGLDSIMAMQLKSQIEQKLGVAISIVPVLQGCSVRELIKQIP